MTADQQTISAPARMHHLLSGFEVSQALYVVAELGVANALLDGPRSLEDLAAGVGADADALERLVRLLASVGVFSMSDGAVEINELGRTLADGPGSMRNVARYLMQTHYEPFKSLLHTVRTGEVAATTHLGQPFFDWINATPGMAELQNSAMAGFTTGIRGDLLDRVKLPDSGRIADIGGADGTLLAEILQRVPELRGIVFDLPNVVSAASSTLAAAGLTDRATAIGGDFFEDAPAADVYVLSAVLHDWDDDSVIRILQNLCRAAAPGAQLLLFELVVPEDDSPHAAKIIDLTMMVMVGGRERTEAQWRRLLETGGFTLDRITSGSGAHCAIEATRRPS